MGTIKRPVDPSSRDAALHASTLYIAPLHTHDIDIVYDAIATPVLEPWYTVGALRHNSNAQRGLGGCRLKAYPTCWASRDMFVHYDDDGGGGDGGQCLTAQAIYIPSNNPKN